MTHYAAYLSVEATTAESAAGIVSVFLDGHQSETDWHTVVEVFAAVSEDGKLNPAIRMWIEDELNRKDEQIAEGMGRFRPIDGKAEGVVMALRDNSRDDEIRQAWTEALETKGASLSSHRQTPDGQHPDRDLWSLHRTLRLMDDYFHHEVGYYDLQYGGTVLYPLEERIAGNPSEQWVVFVDMHN